MKTHILFLALLLCHLSAFPQNEACLREGESVLDEQLFPSSGNQQIDFITANELNFMSTRFLVAPAFYFYKGDNAEATSEVVNPNFPDGTVVFGSQLFNSEFIRSPGGPSIAIIIAHEFGHIVQYKFGGFKHMSVMRKELFADYLAGAYMYIRGGLNVSAVLECFEEMGDTNFGDPDHHGTPQQRTTALKKGMSDAKIYKTSFTLSKAISLGKDYVKEIPDPDEGGVDPE